MLYTRHSKVSCIPSILWVIPPLGGKLYKWNSGQDLPQLAQALNVYLTRRLVLAFTQVLIPAPSKVWKFLARSSSRLHHLLWSLPFKPLVETLLKPQVEELAMSVKHRQNSILHDGHDHPFRNPKPKFTAPRHSMQDYNQLVFLQSHQLWLPGPYSFWILLHPSSLQI